MLVRDAIVAYARPFAPSRNGSTLPLRGIVPVEFRDVHKTTLDLRHKVVAHTDIEYRRPNVTRWDTDDGGHAYWMSTRGVYHEEFIDHAEPLFDLASIVIGNLWERIREFEKDHGELLHWYPRED